MSEIVYINGREIELSGDKSIVYTKQCNDIAELSDRQANFTYKFSAPISAKNVKALNGVSFVGNTSTLPYNKNNVDIIDSDTGLHIIRNGWAQITQTSKNYEINCYDGIIDLFKAIENKTFGDDIDLSEINHTKDLQTIIASFTNENYRYIINDFGGKTHTNSTHINIDYLVPSVRVSYLWNKIFSTFGFNYLGQIFNTYDFQELWLTYPKGISQESTTTTELYATFYDWNDLSQLYTDVTVYYGSSLGYAYVASEIGTYKLELNASGQITFVDWAGVYSETYNAIFGLFINGILIQQFTTFSTLNITLNIGDVVYIGMLQSNEYYNVTQTSSMANYYNDGQSMVINKYATEISFSEELKQLSLTDFFKEILWRFSLTVFKDKDGNYIFKTFEERLQADTIDWSKKYSNRTQENYTPKTYAQNNLFVQNYNDKEGSYNNGNFTINNTLLPEKKEVIKSKIYSAEKELTNFYINSGLTEKVYPTLLWNKEISENTGSQEVKYKELNNRFYFLRNEIIEENAHLKSELLGNSQVVNSFPIARFTTTAFKDFVPRYYNNIKLLLNDFIQHKIELNLSTIDFVNLDFDKIYYFEQEQNYYFLNSIQYQKGKLTVADFYRVKYSENMALYYQFFIYNYEDDSIYFNTSYPYTKTQIFVDIIGVQYLAAFYNEPITGLSLATGTQIRLRDIDTEQILSNTYTIP